MTHPDQPSGAPEHPASAPRACRSSQPLPQRPPRRRASAQHADDTAPIPWARTTTMPTVPAVSRGQAPGPVTPTAVPPQLPPIPTSLRPRPPRSRLRCGRAGRPRSRQPWPSGSRRWRRSAPPPRSRQGVRRTPSDGEGPAAPSSSRAAGSSSPEASSCRAPARSSPAWARSRVAPCTFPASAGTTTTTSPTTTAGRVPGARRHERRLGAGHRETTSAAARARGIPAAARSGRGCARCAAPRSDLLPPSGSWPPRATGTTGSTTGSAQDHRPDLARAADDEGRARARRARGGRGVAVDAGEQQLGHLCADLRARSGG